MADDTNKDKPDPKTTDTNPNKETPKTPTAEEFKAAQDKIAELNEEAKKHRLSAKESKEKADRFEKAFKIATGKDETPDPAALEKAKTDDKFKALLLKAAFVNVAAREMHDADMAFDAVSKQLKDVKVDVETGEVDTDALRKKVEGLKKTSAFLFVGAPAGNGGTPPPPPKPNQGGHPGGANGSAYQQWRTLMADPTRQQEGHEFYAKNKPAIQASWPKS